jgi:ABC-type lipoprotein release transport system permease subunit
VGVGVAVGPGVGVGVAVAGGLVGVGVAVGPGVGVAPDVLYTLNSYAEAHPALAPVTVILTYLPVALKLSEVSPVAVFPVLSTTVLMLNLSV